MSYRSYRQRQLFREKLKSAAALAFLTLSLLAMFCALPVPEAAPIACPLLGEYIPGQIQWVRL